MNIQDILSEITPHMQEGSFTVNETTALEGKQHQLLQSVLPNLPLVIAEASLEVSEQSVVVNGHAQLADFQTVPVKALYTPASNGIALNLCFDLNDCSSRDFSSLFSAFDFMPAHPKPLLCSDMNIILVPTEQLCGLQIRCAELWTIPLGVAIFSLQEPMLHISFANEGISGYWSASLWLGEVELDLYAPLGEQQLWKGLGSSISLTSLIDHFCGAGSYSAAYPQLLLPSATISIEQREDGFTFFLQAVLDDYGAVEIVVFPVRQSWEFTAQFVLAPSWKPSLLNKKLAPLDLLPLTKAVLHLASSGEDSLVPNRMRTPGAQLTAIVPLLDHEALKPLHLLLGQSEFALTIAFHPENCNMRAVASLPKNVPYAVRQGLDVADFAFAVDFSAETIMINSEFHLKLPNRSLIFAGSSSFHPQLAHLHLPLADGSESFGGGFLTVAGAELDIQLTPCLDISLVAELRLAPDIRISMRGSYIGDQPPPFLTGSIPAPISLSALMPGVTTEEHGSVLSQISVTSGTVSLAVGNDESDDSCWLITGRFSCFGVEGTGEVTISKNNVLHAEIILPEIRFDESFVISGENNQLLQGGPRVNLVARDGCMDTCTIGGMLHLFFLHQPFAINVSDQGFQLAIAGKLFHHFDTSIEITAPLGNLHQSPFRVRGALQGDFAQFLCQQVNDYVHNLLDQARLTEAILLQRQSELSGQIQFLSCESSTKRDQQLQQSDAASQAVRAAEQALADAENRLVELRNLLAPADLLAHGEIDRIAGEAEHFGEPAANASLLAEIDSVQALLSARQIDLQTALARQEQAFAAAAEPVIRQMEENLGQLEALFAANEAQLQTASSQAGILKTIPSLIQFASLVGGEFLVVKDARFEALLSELKSAEITLEISLVIAGKPFETTFLFDFLNPLSSLQLFVEEKIRSFMTKR